MDVGAPRDNSSYDDRQNFEVELAAVETRLRGTITELLQPTIQRTTLVCADLEQMKYQVSQHTRGLQEVQLGQFKVMEQMNTIQSFKEEMSRWDQQRRQHEISIDEKTVVMQEKMDAFKYSLDQKESALHHLHRSVDRMATELNRCTDEQEAQKEIFDGRIDEQSKKLNQARAEIDVCIASLELKHNALTDQLWSEETGLAKVAGELRKANGAFGQLEAVVAELQESKAEAAHLDKLRQEVSRMVHEANTSVTQMKTNVGTVVNDVKEHFRTASQTISAHNATFISEVRQQYQLELEEAAKLRGEVQDFMAQMAKSIDSLDARVAGTDAKADALAAEAREEVEELNKRRKRDKTASDNELKALKSKLKGVFDTNDAVRTGLEHITAVMKTMIESDMIQCSLETQDSQDRSRIALLGVKDEDPALCRTNHTEPQRPRPEVQMKPGYPKNRGVLRGGPGVLSKPQEPVVKVDSRCLSCSMQAPLVMAAFKMACLQYTPSPVEYEGSHHERRELLTRRHSLLEAARDGLLEVTAANTVARTSTALVGGVGDETRPAGGNGISETLSEYSGLATRQTAYDDTHANRGVRLPHLAAGGPLTAR